MSRMVNAARANFLVSASSVLVAFASSVVVVRSLGATDFADYATLLGMLTWALLIFEAGGNSGLMRFFPEAERIQARAALLRKVLRLRLATGILAGLLLVLAGPLWVQQGNLPPDTWSPGVFIALAAALTAGLVGLPAQFALLAEFRHGAALLINQAMNLLRSVAVAMVAWRAPSLELLALTVAAVAILEAALYHYMLWPQLKEDLQPPPPMMLPSVLRHGLVTVFDKLSSQIGNGAFLLIVLAAAVPRVELALLAVAADLGVKVLSLAGIPIGAMVLPYLNAARVSGETARATTQVARLSAVLLSTALGGYLAVVGIALPLLFGSIYRDATALAQLIAFGIFVDSWGRLSFSAALITAGRYRAMNLFNMLLAGTAILLLMLTWSLGILAIVAAQAGLRVLGTAVLAAMACRDGLWRLNEAPFAWLGSVLVATGAALLVQAPLVTAGPLAQLAAAVLVFGAIVLVALRSGRCLDSSVVQLAYRVAGRHAKLLRLVIGSAPESVR